MRWVDVSGPPGVGKSTICDPLWHHRAIGWDGLPVPDDWALFIEAVVGLLKRIERHWSFPAAHRMNERSLKKMATVSRMEDERVYTQTGLVQRGVGFAWRLTDMGESIEPVRSYFETMPVSLGAVFFTARPEVLEARNHARRLNPATAHEDRAYQVRLQLPGIELAKDVLNVRRVPFLVVDTEQPIEAARAELVEFASRQASLASQNGPRDQVAVLPASA